MQHWQLQTLDERQRLFSRPVTDDFQVLAATQHLCIVAEQQRVRHAQPALPHSAFATDEIQWGGKRSFQINLQGQTRITSNFRRHIDVNILLHVLLHEPAAMELKLETKCVVEPGRREHFPAPCATCTGGRYFCVLVLFPVLLLPLRLVSD